MKKFRGVFLKNDKEIGLMREANRIVSRILDELGENVRPGVSTMYFEDICRARCDEYGVRPNFLGYQGFPFALCCSVNEEIVHGFPSKERILEEGDIVSFDMGVEYKGFHGDSARTFGVGKVSDEAQKLMDVTRESLYIGIEQARPGNNLYDISAAIQSYVEGFGLGIVRRFVGHGIGSHLHEKPEIPNFVPRGLSGVPLKAGMVLAIEPMVTLGTHEVEVLDDNWTAVTKDGSLSAHFEHSVAVTSDGPRILSLSD
ncbi:type I methionyl aminopeptidase [Pseudodesulfovibrio karagichevae]|uniref:Methionine aminopeptidase n=1 Tax=Pseudodesulfovibrio karagichevae TaxID=3239305 RepID=A0ABV4K6X1_9BACT